MLHVVVVLLGNRDQYWTSYNIWKSRIDTNLRSNTDKAFQLINLVSALKITFQAFKKPTNLILVRMLSVGPQ